MARNNRSGPGRALAFDRLRLRRSPCLVCYWLNGHFVVENFATSKRVTVAPLAAEILQFFDSWRPAGELYRHLGRFDRQSLRQAMATLARATLLERSDRRMVRADRLARQWTDWNPAAGFFHFSTKDTVRAADLGVVERALAREARQFGVPPAVAPRTGVRRVALPAAATDGEFPRVLLERRTWRRFSRRPVELSAIATLLGLTWGVQRWIRTRGLGRAALKTSPSAGARHPLEAYLLALRVQGLDRGLYHYRADTHSLEVLARGANGRETGQYLPNQWWYRSAAAIIFMTAVLPRTQWRYRYPRAYRSILAEAGHVCQTFCLTATWLGLAPFCTMALADSRVERALGVDGVSEAVLYAAGVGARPRGLDWAPLPRHRPGSPWLPP